MRRVSEPEARRGGRFGIKEIVLVLLAVYVIVLAFANSRRVKLDFVFFHAHTRLVYLVLLSALLGAVVAQLAPRLLRRRRR
jgi:uncharacterized integral membrane protein